jgi:hypothetical protein
MKEKLFSLGKDFLASVLLPQANQCRGTARVDKKEPNVSSPDQILSIS